MITPKEKAAEMISEFMNADMNIPHAYAVHCATIAASEVATQMKDIKAVKEYEYWLEVVNQINWTS